MAQLIPRDIEGRDWSLVPLTVGCDFESSKAIAQPGSLADCMNYEITSLGYERSQGLLLYGGTYDAPIENAYYVGELYANASLFGTALTLGSTVSWSGGSGTIAYWNDDGSRYELYIVNVSGTDPSSATYFQDTVSGASLTLTGSRRAQLLTEATDPSTSNPLYDTVTKYLTIVNTINEAIAASSSSTWPYYKPTIPGQGGITGGFQFNDAVYAVRDFYGVKFDAGENEPAIGDVVTIGSFQGTVADVQLTANTWESGNASGYIFFEPASGDTNNYQDFLSYVSNNDTIISGGATVGLVNGTTFNPGKGLLWRAYPQGWKYVDLGYSIRFGAGTNVPSAQVLPLFYADQAAVVQDTGWTSYTTIAQLGDSGYQGWTNLSNLATDNGSNATVTLGGGDSSYLIDAQFLDIIDASDDTEIIGIEVRFEADQGAGSDVQIDRVWLGDQGAGEDYESPIDKGGAQTLDGTPTIYSYGGQTDLWGYDEKTVANFSTQPLRVRVGFTNTGASSRTVSVDYIQVKIHYVAKGQRVYFNDGTSDVATAEIYAFDVHSGTWGGSDAAGWMTLRNVSDTSAIVGGLTIRTDAAGAGDVIATTASQLIKNTLPSEAEMQNESAFYESIQANFYDNDDGRALYGVTGASSAFVFDREENFAFIRLPIANSKDKPRHVAFHANHLVLSTGTTVLVSAPGSPNDFLGGSSWVVKDTIVGLAPTTGTTTAIVCEQSTYALIGTNFDSVDGDAYVQNVSPNSGGFEYTVSEVMDPMYVDFNGVSTIQTTDQYGNFKTRPYTAAIYGWMRDRTQRQPSVNLADRRPVLSVPVRSKNQYRVFFNDGYVLNLAIPQHSEDFAKPMIMHYDPVNLSRDYVPTWADSTILDTGRERVVMGDANGNVWIVDGANGIIDDTGLTEVDCWYTINPYNNKFPQGTTKVPAVTVIGDFLAAQNLNYTIGDSYLLPSGSEYTKELGDYDDAPLIERKHDYTDLNTDTLTDGFSIKVRTTMDGSKPHTMHTLLMHTRRKGANRNNVQTQRG